MACNLLEWQVMAQVRNHRASRRFIKFAPGVGLSSEGDSPDVVLLVSAEGKVQLNEHARVILELCDGSRSRDRVVMDAILRSPGGMRAADVVDFLDAAQSRGWLVEGP
jgi:hypothetical protein